MQVQQKIFAYKIVLTLFKVFHFAITLCRIPVPGNAALSVALLSSIQFSRYIQGYTSVPSKLNNDERKGLTWKIREAFGLT